MLIIINKYLKKTFKKYMFVSSCEAWAEHDQLFCELDHHLIAIEYQSG